MTDLTLLDGAVEQISQGLDGLSISDLSALLEAEQAGKNREDVIDVLAAAQQVHADAAALTAADAPPVAEEAPHPAVDSDPRANTTDAMNRIDFNDPLKSGQEVVEERLREEGGE